MLIMKYLKNSCRFTIGLAVALLLSFFIIQEYPASQLPDREHILDGLHWPVWWIPCKTGIN